jgi:cephalosporin hydroxylase
VIKAVARSARSAWRARQTKQTTDAFTRAYYSLDAYWHETRWLGTPVVKSPLDLWVYQELIWETRPDLIVETGTHRGGSALFLATICELVGHGRVISVDLKPVEATYPKHPRLTYIGGVSSTDPALDPGVRDGERVLVVLDSDHSRDHVRAELDRFAPLVPVGGYVVVEDTAVGGHPIEPGFGPGPMDAVRNFLAEHAEFEVDTSREKFLSTFNPSGFLRRIA